ncbi:MAG: hypothetical protein ACTSXO_10710, partial [Candidatus Heimdallarchaeota archaeon]
GRYKNFDQEGFKKNGTSYRSNDMSKCNAVHGNTNKSCKSGTILLNKYTCAKYQSSKKPMVDFDGRAITQDWYWY